MAGEVDLLLRRGRTIPFTGWLGGLKDMRAVGIIRARLNRIRLATSVTALLAEESRSCGAISVPDIESTFGRQSRVIVVLICGGSKRAQKRDIGTAQKYWKEYLNAEDNRDRTVPGESA